MEGNFGGGRLWQITINSPNLNHLNFIFKIHLGILKHMQLRSLVYIAILLIDKLYHYVQYMAT